MESFGVKVESKSKSKKATTTFGLIRKGTASDMQKMKPHFFRVMLDFMLEDAKIYIPTEFVKRYRFRLGSSVTLKIGNGERWEVELATDDEGLIWLVKGWENFTKHHSLKQGDILVFRLVHDSLFHVMVFDPTASEKKYKLKDVNDLVRRLVNEVKVEEGVDVGKGKGCGEGQKEVGTGRMEDVEAEGKLKQVKKKRGGGEEKRKGKLASPVETPNRPLQTKMRGFPEPRRENASTSSENPNFSALISQYHMTGRYMNVPTKFMFKHMMSENGTMPENHAVIVSGEEGSGPWTLSFVFDPRRSDTGRGRGSFIGGWPAFCRDNSLKPGDACRFELISSGQMKVTIRRG